MCTDYVFPVEYLSARRAATMQGNGSTAHLDNADSKFYHFQVDKFSTKVLYKLNTEVSALDSSPNWDICLIELQGHKSSQGHKSRALCTRIVNEL